ncbi:tetraacyldisaccharide 4'-kinase [Rhodoferax sp.]|uniref:tetraacyldisaccharide 4'-kinase n=1 Tax=Rhodoferax sp. TaxID=50421 RepID=UPI0026204189|nr:tetraacyldisaccharide 4'-kinase [Rhodoferax sp.]MDD2923892.1 tetraacyldisaccharide 4'-kinase [Rhodoferax sp.]
MPAWQATLLHAWTRRGLLAWLLWPVSLLYRLLLGVRRLAYRTGLFKTSRLPVPVVVVVVGNVVAGGAGKTPVVMALVAHWQQRGIRVGVISRGYGRSTRGCLEVTRDCAAQAVGDEPALIHQRTGAPVFVAERRIEAAQALLARHPDTQLIISDDGLQHLPLQRDLEIGVFDDRGIGNGFVLPAGPLREPWPRPLDLVLHTGRHPAFDGFQAQRQLADHAVRADGSRVALEELTRPGAPPLLALAAIAQPEAFFAMLRERGLTLADTLALPDHYDFYSYSGNQYPGYTLICTEKDAVKLWPLRPDALAVPLQLGLPAAFWAALDGRLARLLPTPEPLSSRHGHTTT